MTLADNPEACNVAALLSDWAERLPDRAAVIAYRSFNVDQPSAAESWTFRQLDDDSSAIALGLKSIGAVPGTRLAMLVPVGFEFVSLVFACFKAGVVPIMIDPGMGRKNLIGCLAGAQPEGFLAIPKAQAIRTLLRSKFPAAKLNVTVGPRLFWGGVTLKQLRANHLPEVARDRVSVRGQLCQSQREDPAAIIFTSGGTGVPKGVHYCHGNFARQVQQIQERYAIEPGGTDVACFPLFALFNAGMGNTTVLPKMNFSRPAQASPQHLVQVIAKHQATQAFASPAVWRNVGAYCRRKQIKLPSVKRVLAAGAPVSPDVLQAMKNCLEPEGDMHTPYGATEALPVASNSATCVLGETVNATRAGKGTCVGTRFSGIEWKVIEIEEGPIADITMAKEVPPGTIGEIIVRGEVVTKSYFNNPKATAAAKISAANSFWHRMGDTGYLDEQDRFWFCGRVAHRVLTAAGTMYTIPCEALFNNHPAVFRSALVGIGEPGQQEPVIVIELEPATGGRPVSQHQWSTIKSELQQIVETHELTRNIKHVLRHPSLPVDIRHNVKIFREQLSGWAEKQLESR
ncbi:MAG: fatty acid CoA ligase family protein [Pirellulales bacterium]|nr:fatty acid CoA ligase family protein [Pirellulales bacterium]